MKTIKFKINTETELPQDLIDDAPSQGRFDDYAEYILKNFDVQVSLKDSKAYLKSLGTWENSELNDLEENKARILWISLLDCKEQGIHFWYMGS